MKINVSIFVVLFCCIISTLFPTKSYACSCAYEPHPDKAIEQAKAVFTGKVLEVKQEVTDVEGILVYRNAVLFDVGSTDKHLFIN